MERRAGRSLALVIIVLANVAISACEPPRAPPRDDYSRYGDPLALPPIVLRCLARGDSCGGSFRACRALAHESSKVQSDADACFAMADCDAYAECFARTRERLERE